MIRLGEDIRQRLGRIYGGMGNLAQVTEAWKNRPTPAVVSRPGGDLTGKLAQSSGALGGGAGTFRPDEPHITQAYRQQRSADAGLGCRPAGTGKRCAYGVATPLGEQQLTPLRAASNALWGRQPWIVLPQFINFLSSGGCAAVRFGALH
jgi:hypothetical protein